MRTNIDKDVLVVMPAGEIYVTVGVGGIGLFQVGEETTLYKIQLEHLGKTIYRLVDIQEGRLPRELYHKLIKLYPEVVI